MRTTIDAAVLVASLNADPLFERLEDGKALSLVREALDLLRSVTEAAGGRAVKTIGDELMALFPDALSAATAAADMHRRFAPHALAWPGGSALTIGVAWGPVVEEGGEVFGDTVGIASSANSGPVRKKPGTVVMDGAAFQQLPGALQSACRLVQEVTRPGKGKLAFYAISSASDFMSSTRMSG